MMLLLLSLLFILVTLVAAVDLLRQIHRDMVKARPAKVIPMTPPPPPAPRAPKVPHTLYLFDASGREVLYEVHLDLVTPPQEYTHAGRLFRACAHLDGTTNYAYQEVLREA